MIYMDNILTSDEELKRCVRDKYGAYCKGVIYHHLLLITNSLIMYRLLYSFQLHQKAQCGYFACRLCLTKF